MKKEAPAETAATGSLGPVTAKLAALLGSEYKLRRGTRRDVKFIKSKFKSMHSLLWATWEREVFDAASKELKIEALVLADAVDDAVDDFILTMEPSRRSKRLVQTKIKASPFQDFKTRSNDVSGRCRIQWKNKTAAQPICSSLFSRNNAILGPRKATPRAHPFVRKHASKLVPMDDPRNELIKFLVGEDAESTLLQPRLKMASILGMAGMGKTTLADLVYEKIENKFQARAFVSLTPGGDIKELLAGILEQVAPENTAPPAGTEEHHLLQQISDFLEDKRYLVIIDDIWHWGEWEIISKCLPKNNLGSRVVTTTRVNGVAEKWRDDCDALVHKMHPQFNRGGRLVYKIGSTEDVCNKIIGRNAKTMAGKGFIRKHPIVDMCAGMPLAVVCMLSAVGKEREKQAEHGVEANTRDVQDMIEKQVMRHGIQNTPGFEPLVESLQLGYNDLPHEMLKSCLLYCSVYSEEHDFERGDVVRRWMAEGFVQEEEAGKSYYTELCSRGLIFNIVYEGDDMCIIGYRMHPMVRNFLKWKSHEDDFITCSSGIQSSAASSPAVIRRLLIDHWPSRSSDDLLSPPTGTDYYYWSHVRSLVVCKDAERVPYKHLKRVRVLDVQKNHGLENHHVKDMCGVLRLRHLFGQLGSRITEIPSEIARLQHLETLEVTNTWIRQLPGETGRLQQVRTLLLGHNALKVLPRELGALQQLVTLDISWNRDLRELPREIGGLHKLRDLRAIGAGITQVPKEMGKLERLENLNMSRTGITVLPWDIMKLHKLERLDLSETKVEKIPWKTGGLNGLKTLIADYKTITVPLDVCQLPELVELPECIRQVRNDRSLLSSLARENLSFQKSDRKPYPGGLAVGAKQMRVPLWIQEHFSELTILDIKVCKLEEESLKILREMPNLYELSLRFQVIPKEPVAISCQGFARLSFLCVDSRVPRVCFLEGAMPGLFSLTFLIRPYGGPQYKDPLGITNLGYLNELQIQYDEEWCGEDTLSVRATVDVLRNQARKHPSHIYFKINEIYQKYEILEEAGSSSSSNEIQE